MTNPNGVRLGLNIIPANTGNFSCTPPPPFVKVIYISEDLQGTGAITGIQLLVKVHLQRIQYLD